MADIVWLHRDIYEQMWLGDINVSDPSDITKYPFRWKINNKRARKREIRAEWVAVRSSGYGQKKLDAEFFENLTALYVPNINL